MQPVSILNLFFAHRQRRHDQYATHGDTIQKEQLRYLLHAARNTEIGKRYDFAGIKSYADFASRLPVIDYEGIKPYVDRMLHGENNLIWPSRIKWFAKSSGTTNDKSKFIPVRHGSRQRCPYLGRLYF